MKNKLTILVCSLFMLTLSLKAGNDVWTLYQAYHETDRNIPVTSSDGSTTVYALYAGNLLAYDATTGEVQLLSKLTGLSGHGIASMDYSAATHTLVLVYADLGIDLLSTRSGEGCHLSHLQSAGGGTATFNDLTVTGSSAIVATSAGVAVVDLRQQAVLGFFTTPGATRSAALSDNGILYAATDSGLKYGDLTANLSDPTSWQTLTSLNRVSLLTAVGGSIGYVNSSGGATGLWQLSQTSVYASPVTTRLSSQIFTARWTNGREAVFSGNGSAALVAAGSEGSSTLQASLSTPPSPLQHLTHGTGRTYWASCGTEGLQPFTLNADGTLQATGEKIGGYGPHRDLCYYLTYAGERLLVAGGRLDPLGVLHYPGTVMAYENGEWTNFQETGIEEETGLPYRDITRIIQDPSIANHHFASAGGGGLYEFRDGKFVGHYSLHNSLLRSAASDPNPDVAKRYVRVDGLNYDGEGNLWMVNMGTDTIINIMRADGKWTRLYVEAIAGYPTLEKTLFDADGRFWVASRRWAGDKRGGLLGLDYAGTIDNTADDVAKYRYSAFNQDGKTCDFSEGVFDILRDRDGSIWMGTAAGLYVVEDPSEWFGNNFNVTQIKVPRNDGTNYADYLLDGVAVSALALDGAGRKWIGTASNGLYLVSQDGTEILHHFEAASSPLLSDCIYDLAINPTTGEVMIATDAGLCAYQGDATEPSASLDADRVKVYPNPVRPEYHGRIVVSGLTDGADVKVTTASGVVVAGGVSNGGTFVWDGCNRGGRRVATGVYYIMVSTADGKKGIATKVVVI